MDGRLVAFGRRSRATPRVVPGHPGWQQHKPPPPSLGWCTCPPGVLAGAEALYPQTRQNPPSLTVAGVFPVLLCRPWPRVPMPRVPCKPAGCELGGLPQTPPGPWCSLPSPRYRGSLLGQNAHEVEMESQTVVFQAFHILYEALQVPVLLVLLPVIRGHGDRIPGS